MNAKTFRESKRILGEIGRIVGGEIDNIANSKNLRIEDYVEALVVQRVGRKMYDILC